MMKREIKINGVMGSLEEGKPAIILIGDKWYTTSPVQSYFVGGSRVYLETENSIYKN